MDNFDVKFEETLNAFNTEGDSVIVIPQGGEGKIQSISVNGEEQPIVNKNVDIKVPSKTSQLENDSDFATTNDIPTKVSDFENDSKFVNEETLETAKQELKDYVDETEKVGDTNIIEGIKVNGSKLTPNSQKEVDIVIPTKTSDLKNDSNFATTDNIPNVPNWALQPNKPSYSYSEITDKPTIPSKTSELTNDSSFVTVDYVNDQIGNIGEVLDAINADLSAI